MQKLGVDANVCVYHEVDFTSFVSVSSDDRDLCYFLIEFMIRDISVVMAKILRMKNVKS